MQQIVSGQEEGDGSRGGTTDMTPYVFYDV